MSTLAPCGTRQARRRHKRNNTTCDVCAVAVKTPGGTTLAPCGTVPARQRHKRRGETCNTCGPLQPVLPPKPCGTAAAIKRHRYHGEPVCDVCKQGDRERAETRRRQQGIPERITLEDLITEIRFLIHAGEGEHRILQATGYVGRGHSLRTRLGKAGQHHLANQIFGWDLAA